MQSRTLGRCQQDLLVERGDLLKNASGKRWTSPVIAGNGSPVRTTSATGVSPCIRRSGPHSLIALPTNWSKEKYRRGWNWIISVATGAVLTRIIWKQSPTRPTLSAEITRRRVVRQLNDGSLRPIAHKVIRTPETIFSSAKTELGRADYAEERTTNAGTGREADASTSASGACPDINEGAV